MAKHRPSLEAFAQSAAPIPVPAAPAVETVATNVVELASPAAQGCSTLSMELQR
jgi:hypothetical protein